MMDILKAEIARKRKLLEDKALVGESKKYFKRSELARKDEEAYFERCGLKVPKFPRLIRVPGCLLVRSQERGRTLATARPMG